MNDTSPDQQHGWLMIAIGWALAFTVVCAGYYVLQQDDNPYQLSVIAQRDGELILERNAQGHYLVEGTVNGQRTKFLVDTGATQVALSSDLAERAGLEKISLQRIQTAGGVSDAWLTRIDELQIGFLTFTNLRAVIVPDLEIDTVLLGMNALERLEINQNQGVLRLRPTAQNSI